MRKMLIIAAREYRAAVRTKSFVVSLVLMPVLMSGGAIIGMISKRLDDTGVKRFAIVDRTPGEQLYKLLEAASDKRNSTDLYDPETGKQTRPTFLVARVEPSPDNKEAIDQQRYELSKRVHQDEFYGFLEIGPEVLSYSPALPTSAAVGPPKKPSDRIVLRYQSNNPTYGAFARWAERVLNAAIHAQRSLDAGVSTDKLYAVLQPVPLMPKGLSKRDPDTGKIEDPPAELQTAHLLVPAGLMGMMFTLIMIGATPLMQSVVEEKMQRIAEVLLGSVRPFELMMGKLLGMVGVSLTIDAVYLAGAYWAARHYEYTDYLSIYVLTWFVIFQILAVFLYGSIFIAVGAACTDMKETQTLLMPVMMIAVLPLFFIAPVLQQPNSAFALGMSLIPVATPMLMITRLALPPGIPLWQPLLGVAGLLVTTLLFVYVAGRIFRVGILLQGKGARFGEIVRWAIHG